MSLFEHSPANPAPRPSSVGVARQWSGRQWSGRQWSGREATGREAKGRGWPGNAPSRFGPAEPADPAGRSRALDYPLAGLLRCAACELPLRPAEMLGGRAYGAPCGCRLMVVSADLLERLVYDAVAAREPAVREPAARDQPPAATDESWAALFRRHLAEVRLGGTVDDLFLVWLV